jgi:hypothetical protein
MLGGDVSTLRTALYQAMVGDETLTALLATPESVYHRLAPVGVEPPYVIFRQQSGRREWASQGGQLRWPLWLIKGVDRGGSSDAAEAIDARIDTILTDRKLTFDGFDHLYLRREQDIPESVGVDDGELLQECGGLYRIAMEPT